MTKSKIVGKKTKLSESSDENKKSKFKKPNGKSKENKQTPLFYLKFYQKSKDTNTPISLNKKFTLHYPTVSNVNPLFYLIKDFYIGSYDCSDQFIYIGLKRNNSPFNIFEKKTGESHIVVLDENLNFKRELKFNHGDVVQIRVDGNDCYVLFSDGNLLQISLNKDGNSIEMANRDDNSIETKNKDYNNSIKTKNKDYNPPIETKNKDENNSIEITDKEFHYLSFDLLINRKVFENNFIVNFDVFNHTIVCTDGSSLFINNSTLSFNVTIIQVLLFENFIFCLDIQGKVFQLDLDLKNKKELISNYTIERIERCSGYVIGHSSSEYFILASQMGDDKTGLSNRKTSEELNKTCRDSECNKNSDCIKTNDNSSGLIEINDRNKEFNKTNDNNGNFIEINDNKSEPAKTSYESSKTNKEAKESNFLGFFTVKENSFIFYSKRYKNRKKTVQFLKVIDNSILKYNDKEYQLNIEKGNNGYISRIIDKGSYVLFATENGLICKVFYV